VRQLGQFEPLALTGVGAEDPEAARVRDDGDAPSEGERLARQERRDVDELFEAVGPEDAGLLEQRIDCRVRSGQGSRV